MEFSVCTDKLFGSGNDICQSIWKVSECGFNTFEFWYWWSKDPLSIRQAMDRLHMKCAAFCTKVVSLTEADRLYEYLEGLKETLEVAKLLDCEIIISQAGNEIEGLSRELQHKTLVFGLKAAAKLVEKADVTLVLEPLNVKVDHTGYFLYSSTEAFEVIREVGSENVKLLFDIYHQQISSGNIIADITGNIDYIGHFHAAGAPGRGTILSGEINYFDVIKAIEETGYSGFFGIEYLPKDDPVKSLIEIKKAFT